MADNNRFRKVIVIWISENIYLIPYELEYTESIKTGPNFQTENLRLNYTITSKMLYILKPLHIYTDTIMMTQ